MKSSSSHLPTSKSTAVNTRPMNRTSQIKMLEAASNSPLSRAREPAPSEATSRVRAQTPAIAFFRHFSSRPGSAAARTPRPARAADRTPRPTSAAARMPRPLQEIVLYMTFSYDLLKNHHKITLVILRVIQL